MIQPHQELYISYKNAISKMDINNIKPYTETEIQPLYSQYWVNNIILQYLNINPNTNNISNFINPSVIRSMLIMDLMDCEFSKNYNIKIDVFNWYINIIKNIYGDDIFSLHSNRPNTVNIENINNFIYFADTNSINILILNKLFEISYKKNQDIYADNTYEVLGDYTLRKINTKCILYKFYNILQYDTISIYVYFNTAIDGEIDLFGHSTHHIENAKYTIVINDVDLESYYEYANKQKLYNNISNYLTSYNTNTTTLYDNIYNRLYRYHKLLNIDINIESTKIYNDIYNMIIQDRITDINTLQALIKIK